MPTRLDEILFEDLPTLAQARQAEDKRMVAYANGLTEADLCKTLTYRTITNPADVTLPLALALAHFFDHQTHHRGQAHALVTIAAENAAMPPLDLIFFQRETGVELAWRRRREQARSLDTIHTTRVCG